MNPKFIRNYRQREINLRKYFPRTDRDYKQQKVRTKRNNK